MSVVGVLMYIPKKITAVVSVISLLVEARLNSCFRALLAFTCNLDTRS